MHDIPSIVRRVVAKFFGEQVPLQEAVLAEAQEYALNEHMIRRLCEQANTETRLQFYRRPGINQATALFEPADAEKVIQIVISPKEEPDMHSDYISPPSMATIIVQKEAAPMQKVAKALPAPTKHEIMEKRAMVQIRYSDFQDARHAFLKEAVNHLRGGGTPKDVNKMASCVDGQEMLRAVSAHLPKEASDIKDLMNENLKVTYVIGDHPLVLKYKHCIMQGDKLKDSIVQLEKVEQINKEAGLLGALGKYIIKKPIPTAFYVGLPAAMGYMAYNAKRGAQDQVSKNFDAGSLSSYGPEVQSPYRMDPDVLNLGPVAANLKQRDADFADADARRHDSKSSGSGTSATSSKPEGRYEIARREGRNAKA